MIAIKRKKKNKQINSLLTLLLIGISGSVLNEEGSILSHRDKNKDAA